MSSDLSRDAESFIDGEISLGVYRDRQEALEAGVKLLRQHKALLDRLDESRRQLDEGEYVEFDQEGLRLFFEGLKERARRAAQSK
jgi:Arc/MetJ-type ribon-helix-helix transcriptional regulator